MTTREPLQPGDRHAIETKEAFDLLPGKADAAGDGKSVERGLQPWERQFVSHGPQPVEQRHPKKNKGKSG